MDNRRDSSSSESEPPASVLAPWWPLSPRSASPMLQQQFAYSNAPYHPLQMIHSASTSSQPQQPLPAGSPGLPTVPSPVPPANKVAIPRIAAPSNPLERHRAVRACNSCRQRKIKCDSKRPVCGQCAYNGKCCAYEDVKRVRNQKMIETLTERSERYERVLRDIEGDVDAHTAHKIRRAIRVKDDTSMKVKGENDFESASSVGSLDAIDGVREDLSRDENTRAAGFFGKNSEIQWMQRLEESVRNQRQSREQASSTSPGVSPMRGLSKHPQGTQRNLTDGTIATVNYHLDDLSIPLPDSNIDVLAVPQKEIADEYLNAYMTQVHPFFGAVRKSTFRNQYEQFMGKHMMLAPPRKWLAILNMIFAIGCRHCRLMAPAQSAIYENDLVFLSRARHLGLHSNILFEHADLQQIQLEFLIAIYLLSLGQLNRASKFSSMALHAGISLGINLRLKDDTHSGSKEARSRLWWSIYSLENLIASMNGRVSGVNESLCAVALPIPIEQTDFEQLDMQSIFANEEQRESRLRATLFENSAQLQSREKPWASHLQPSPSLFFFYLVDLSLITQAILNRIYSLEGVHSGITKTEYQLEKFVLRMDHWLYKLADCYQFVVSDASPWHINHAQLDDESHPYVRERVCLALNYYSARVTLYRPCLISQTFHTDDSTNNSNTSVSPSRDPPRAKPKAEITAHCLQAACSLISIFPDKIDITWLARIAPWWSVLHFLMQATTALLLSISYCSIPDCSSSSPGSTNHNSSASASASASSPESTNHSSNHTTTTRHPTLLKEELQTAIAQTKKAVSWIHAMAAIDPAARRGFLFCDRIVQKTATALKIDLHDWPSAATLVGAEEEPKNRMEGIEEWIDFEDGFM